MKKMWIEMTNNPWGLWVKCTVLVIQQYCSQTLSTYHGGWERCSPIRRECGA